MCIIWSCRNKISTLKVLRWIYMDTRIHKHYKKTGCFFDCSTGPSALEPWLPWGVPLNLKGQCLKCFGCMASKVQMQFNHLRWWRFEMIGSDFVDHSQMLSWILFINSVKGWCLRCPPVWNQASEVPSPARSSAYDHQVVATKRPKHTPCHNKIHCHAVENKKRRSFWSNISWWWLMYKKWRIGHIWLLKHISWHLIVDFYRDFGETKPRISSTTWQQHFAWMHAPWSP